jgi:hypothetical protein
MEFAEIISYIATGFLLISYCCRTVKLRIFQLIGIIFNLIFAWMILDQSPSARSIIVSNIIYFIINFIQLFRELDRLNNRDENKKYKK